MKPLYIIVHHTGGTDANPLQDSSNFTFKQCDDWHKVAKDGNGNFLYHYGKPSSLGYYCGYTYYIEKDGKVFKAREDDEVGAHAKGYNDKSIGICLAGNFDATMPTAAQIAALQKLLFQKTSQWSIRPENVVPHRKFASKTCYGTKLGDSWARDLIQAAGPSPAEILKKATSLIEEGHALLKTIKL